MSTILITGSGGPAGLALARQLVGSDHRVIGADMALPSAAARSSYDEVVQVPPVSDPAYLLSLLDIISEHNVDLLIPTVQEELPLISSASELLGIAVAVAPPGPVALAHDKLLTMWALARDGVPIPHTIAGERHSIDLGVWEDPPNLIVKPRCSRGGRGVQMFSGTATLPSPQDLSGMIVQEFAPGEEYAVQIYLPMADPRTANGKQGVALQAGGGACCVVLKKTALKQGRIGNAAAAEVAHEPLVASVALDAVRSLGLTGPVDLDIRRSGNGAPLVLEVNARFGAQSELAPELLEALLRDFSSRGLPKADS